MGPYTDISVERISCNLSSIYTSRTERFGIKNRFRNLPWFHSLLYFTVKIICYQCVIHQRFSNGLWLNVDLCFHSWRMRAFLPKDLLNNVNESSMKKCPKFTSYLKYSISSIRYAFEFHCKYCMVVLFIFLKRYFDGISIPILKICHIGAMVSRITGKSIVRSPVCARFEQRKT